MDTQSLQAFIAVADTASFSLAGERLHLTQPAISKRIAALEAQTDAKLFDRINRRVSLTEAGRLLLPQARRILQLVEESRRQLHDLSGQVAGSRPWPPATMSACTACPRCSRPTPALSGGRPRSALSRLRAGLPERGLGGDRTGGGDPGTAAQPAGGVGTGMDRPPALRRRPRAPAGRASRVSLGELARHPAVLPGPLTFTRDIVVDAFSRAGLTISVALSTNYLETLKMMAGIGLGWSVLPESMIDAE